MNRKTVWTTHHGEKIQVRDMEDTHIANLLHYLWCLYRHYGKDTNAITEDRRYICFDDERRRRGLSAEFINRAPYPYRAPNGQLRIWDADRMNSVPFEPQTPLRHKAMALLSRAQRATENEVEP